MEETEDNMSTEDIKDFDTPSVKTKPKKRSLVERELETNLTERITSPIVSDTSNTSRYGRARRFKTESESSDSQKVKPLKSPQTEKSPMKSPVYKMHASNSPVRVETPTNNECGIDHQIETIYNENISLSRFGDDKKYMSPMKQQKVYVRKDLIQSKEKEESITLIKNLYSPVKSSQKTKSHISNVLERSSDRFNLTSKQNSYLANSSVVKTLDFDNNKKRSKNIKTPSKSDLFDLEAKCEYQVGDLAWAKMGTYPYWPCIVTRDPYSEMFMKKKLFGRVERDVIHVTFFGDNGRRSWIVDNMLRKFLGQLEFEAARESFTPEARKKDPRCAAYFVSEKKLAQWTVSVEEAETLLREPKRLRIDLLNDMLNKSRPVKTTPKGRKITRADSDVSLSESLYDTLFSEEDSKSIETDNSKTSTRKKSLDVSEVVTACLDNMAAKTGITKIQKQSHMDRWLQKAKSKTPEKSQLKSQKTSQPTTDTKKNKKGKKDSDLHKPFRFTSSDHESLGETDSKLQSHQNEHDYNGQCSSDNCCLVNNADAPGVGIITKVESLNACSNNDLSTKANDSQIIMNEDCIVAEEMIVESDDIIARDEMNDVVINKEKTVQEDSISIITISSTISKNGDDNCEVSVSGSEDQIECISNNASSLRGSVDLYSKDKSLLDSEQSKTKGCVEAVEETQDVILSEFDETTSASEVQTPLKNGLDKKTKYTDEGFSENHKLVNDKKILNGTNYLTHINRNNDVINEDDQEIRDVNIATKILNDKLVETYGLENKPCMNAENNFTNDVETSNLLKSDKFYENSEFIESNYNTDSSQDITDKSLNNDNPLNSSLHETCADIYYERNTQKVDSSKEDESYDEFVTNQINCNSTCDVLTNGIFHKSDNFIETESTFGDDERSSNSTPNNFEGFSVYKRKKDNRHRLIRKIHKRFRNIENAKNIDKTPNKHGIDLYDTALNTKSLLLNGVTTPDDSSSQTTEESETTDSEIQNPYKDKIGLSLQDLDLRNSKELTTDSEPSSKKSKETCNSYSKSMYSDQLTETDLQVDTTDSMEVDESTCDTVIQNGYHKPIKEDYETEYIDRNINTLNVHVSKEKAIMDGDELRLTPNGFEIIKDNYIKQTTAEQIDMKKDSDTISLVSIDSEASLIRNAVTQNGHIESSKNNFKIDLIKNSTSTLSVYANKEDDMLLNSLTHDGDIETSKNSFETSENSFKIDMIENGKITLPVNANKKDDILNTEELSILNTVTQNCHNESVKIHFEIDPIENNPLTLPVASSEDDDILNREKLNFTRSCVEICQESETKKDDEIQSVKIKEEDTASVVSTDSEVSLSKRKMRWKVEKQVERKTPVANSLEDPEFLKYIELKQDDLYDEHPDFSQEEITTYLYNTWLYEQSLKTDSKKIDDKESANMVKGLQSEPVIQSKEVKKRTKVKKEKDYESKNIKEEEIIPKQKPKRRTVRPSYNEEYSDIESDLEVFRIFKPVRKEIKVVTKTEAGVGETEKQTTEIVEIIEEEEIDEVEEYFAQLAEPKPNVFKGLLRERVCDICEKPSNLVKCKGCTCMFHVTCVKKETEIVEVQAPVKGRKKKKKTKGRKSKSDENGLDETDGHSDDKDANVSEDIANTSTDNIEPESHIVADAEEFEAKLAIKMKELLGEDENAIYDSISSEEELDWSDTEAGKCEVVDIKLRKKNDQELIDYSEFKCNNCQKYDVPICFVCRSAESPKNNALHRQKCQVPQCNTYYHLECLEHWPQTQFNSGECAKFNKKVNEYFESLTCPRHVCHTCVSDDPRGCKTRFSGDKLAKCVRCPATYHSFTKCLPAGSQILTGSHIICPRHYEHRPGKVPCHVNTGWCFICALGGTLICCEYCPTSFHAECLNIKPPEGSYMCEDCETGRLPLYGEMVWVKLGHYRWWPGIILHPCEIPENIMAVKHSQGEFVVRFFGQYDHYWVNRGRVFPFQEGDSGKVSSQKSKIDAAFTMAMEHAIRACEILKNATENEEESIDIASSLLPPHYVKLRTNKPCGALCGRRVELQESSLTQCECSPSDTQPCGPYTHCLNRMLLTECGPTCRAGDRCNNRAFEKRQYPKLVPYRTPHRGWGLKTLEDIKAGQFVIEYVGELIDEEEFQRRMRRKHEIRDENFYFLTLDKERMIDAGPKGNLARFMNHCCEPNCETQKWTVLGDVRVGLFALYDIPANSEVTFNYNLESAGIEKKRCLCGAKRCSGYIGAKPKQLQTDQQKKSKLPPKKTYNKKKKVEDSPTTSKTKPKPKLGRPPKPKELTEIEKDLLIIKIATNGVSSDSDCSVRLTNMDLTKEIKSLKRKRVDNYTEEASCSNSSPMKKKVKVDDEKCSDICD